MIVDMEEAKEFLRIDGDYADGIIEPLLEAIPDYLETATGYDWASERPVHPVAKSTAKFILLLWFDTQTEDSERLRRTIDSLLTSLTLIGRTYHV